MVQISNKSFLWSYDLVWEIVLLELSLNLRLAEGYKLTHLCEKIAKNGIFSAFFMAPQNIFPTKSMHYKTTLRNFSTCAGRIKPPA